MVTSSSPVLERPAGTGPTAGGRYAAIVAGRRTKWAVLVLWLILIAAGGTFASKIGSIQNNEASTWLPAKAESTQALKVGDQYFADKNVSTAVVVFHRAGGLSPQDLAFIDQHRSQLVAAKVAVGDIATATVSPDKQAALLRVPLRSSPSDNSVLGNAVDKVHDIANGGAPAGLEVRIAGPAGNISDFIHVFAGLDGALLGATIGIVALLLLITYRSPVLFLIPLLAVGIASQVASGVVYLLAKHAGLLVNGESSSVLTVLVLGVGTDYALLLVSRYREELARHEDRHAAMAAALARCLPAITASAATVILATLCLLAGRMNSTRGLGPVAAVGVAVALLAMVSLLPALLVILGRWAFWPFVPRYSPTSAPAGAEGQHRFWARIAALVGRAHRPVWIGTAVVLVALAVGIGTLHIGQTQADQFTKRVDSVAGQQLISAHFPAGSSSPVDIYAHTDQAPAVLQKAEGITGIAAATVAASNAGWVHATAVLTVSPDTQAAQHAVLQLRATLDQLPGEPVLVGGQSAVALDTGRAQSGEEKLLFPLILAIVFIMLLLLLRSVVAPVLLLVSVVLSYLAALGTAALLFRALGHAHIDKSLLLFGFLFLVALGVDYTIFLMTRVREEALQHGHRAGVLTGLTVTGGVITSAGLVLAASFSVLAVLPVVSSLQEGLLVAVGVLLDTFLVRSLLVPALALQLGPKLWWPARIEP